MKKITNSNGITLIALIITIIVMLILVGVTVNVIMKGGMFSTAKKAAQDTEEKAMYEKIIGAIELSDDGKINVKETYNKTERMFANIELLEPDAKENIQNKAVFEITGSQGTYTYTITDKEVKIGNGKELIIEKTEISENSLKLRITPVITADLFTEEEACQLLGFNDVEEGLLSLYNECFYENQELQFESFEALATAKRNVNTGLIELGELPDFGIVAPFKDAREGLKNMFKAASENPNTGFPSGVETVQDYVKFAVVSDSDIITEKVLKINGENVSRDVTWDDIVATYSVYNPSTYKIEIDLVLGDIEKTITRTGEITVNEIKEAPKVSYVGKDVKYDNKDWKVLYDDETHGLQLISMQAMGNVTLGKNLANVTVGGNVKEEAIESYNKAITKLTEECYKLISDKSAVNSVRNIGGPETDTTTDTTYTFPNNFFNDSTLFDTYNNKLKIADNSYYTEDYKRMNDLNILKTTNSKSSSYWMASRYIDGTTSINFNIRRISPAGDSTWLRLISISKSGTVTTDPYTCQVRPVITIKPEYSLVSNGSYYTLAK